MHDSTKYKVLNSNALMYRVYVTGRRKNLVGGSVRVDEKIGLLCRRCRVPSSHARAHDSSVAVHKSRDGDRLYNI